MLKELGVFIESLQRELELQGCKATDVQVEIKCKSLIEWAVLDQAVERDLEAENPRLFLADESRIKDRIILPHMLTYRHTPIRITYER